MKKHLILFLFSAMSVRSIAAVAGPWDIEAVEVPGVYSVPVEPALAPFASYPMAKVCWSVVNGEAKLGYHLPLALTGAPRFVEIRGPIAAPGVKFNLSSAADSAVCERQATGAVSCRVVYEPGGMDLELAKQAILQGGFPAGEADVRNGIAAQFQNEPIGVIEFNETPAP